MNKIDNITFEKMFSKEIHNVRVRLYLQSHGSRYIVNLASTKQLKDLLFNKLGESPLKRTKKDNAQVDSATLDKFAEKYEWLKHLLEYRKLTKLLNTYVQSILELNEDAITYPDWLMHGTDSGRYACRNPNFMNIPRDDVRIKKGIVARKGYKLIGSDYSQLEARIFSSVSNEFLLIDAFKKDEDLYGRVAIQLFNLECQPNEVKKKYPDKRQISKNITLGLAYGLKKWKLSKMLDCELEEAEEFIDNFWQTYPDLDRWVKKSHAQVYKTEQISTELGRIRHLNGLHELRRNPDAFYQVNRLLNISINFQIQSLAASIVNRAMVKIADEIKKQNIDAFIIMQIHDELIVEVKEDQAEGMVQIMKQQMENIYELKVPLIANPIIADKLSETK